MLCIMVVADYKPGDMPPKGYLAWHEWAGIQHKAGLRQECCGNCDFSNYLFMPWLHCIHRKNASVKETSICDLFELEEKEEAEMTNPTPKQMKILKWLGKNRGPRSSINVGKAFGMDYKWAWEGLSRLSLDYKYVEPLWVNKDNSSIMGFEITPEGIKFLEANK